MAKRTTIDGLMPANDHGRCPICRAPGVASYRPFCSKRCADVDLARWLGGTYAIPGGGTDEEEDNGEAARVGLSEAERQAMQRSRDDTNGDA